MRRILFTLFCLALALPTLAWRSPDTALGCTNDLNFNGCVYVVGSGLSVSTVKAGGNNGPNGHTNTWGPTYDQSGTTFHNWDRLCGWWSSHYLDKGCVTIHD